MAKIKANKQTLIRWKVYIDRARMYIGYAQFLMLLFVLLEAYKETYFGELIFNNLIISTPILFLVFMVLSLIVGRIDTVLGLREEELRNASTSNPVMRELLTKVDELTNEIRALKEEKNS
ncbi:hypothetical protein [Reichenbachiella versicolor]|uniref:hypothetical protein n=1 Tax=Reichenbachiella versicolor TaxID=1821036 RepID=UPI000D6DC788|nr:hypothetical protein [Reichenbachiella versicolor]